HEQLDGRVGHVDGRAEDLGVDEEDVAHRQEGDDTGADLPGEGGPGGGDPEVAVEQAAGGAARCGRGVAPGLLGGAHDVSCVSAATGSGRASATGSPPTQTATTSAGVPREKSLASASVGLLACRSATSSVPPACGRTQTASSCFPGERSPTSSASPSAWAPERVARWSRSAGPRATPAGPSRRCMK